jgi:hypothetical protein
MDAPINGSIRAKDGTFWMQAHRQFPTDGRQPRSIDRLLDLVRRYEKLLPYTAHPSIEVVLRAIVQARERLDEIEYEAVAVVRGFQWSWRTIAGVLGMSPTVAHRKFAHARRERALRPNTWEYDLDDDLEDLF